MNIKERAQRTEAMRDALQREISALQVRPGKRALFASQVREIIAHIRSNSTSGKLMRDEQRAVDDYELMLKINDLSCKLYEGIQDNLAEVATELASLSGSTPKDMGWLFKMHRDKGQP